MGLLDKAKQAAEQAATKAKEGVEDVQTKRELSQSYTELGKTAYELVTNGELSDPRLDAAVAKITALQEKQAAAGAAAGNGAGAAPADPSKPPAMPT
jgi:hypothetical protein